MVWNVTVMNCTEGILIKPKDIEESDRNEVINVTPQRNKVINVTACNNRKIGFKVEKGDKNKLFGCLAKDNGQQGFKIKNGDNNSIYFSKAISNGRDGIEIDEGSGNLVFFNHVEDNGDPKIFLKFDKDYSPWFYAGIDIQGNSQNNQIKHNRAGCNLGCVGCVVDDKISCKARYRDFWDENVDVDEIGNCVFTNKWENNRIVCKNAMPEPLCVNEGDD